MLPETNPFAAELNNHGTKWWKLNPIHAASLVWLKIQSSVFFRTADVISMAILSFSDHISDLIVLVLWFISKDIPVSIPLMGSVAFSMTAIVPILLFENYFIKMAMPIGLGMLALIYEFEKDPTNVVALDTMVKLREAMGQARISFKECKLSEGVGYIKKFDAADFLTEESKSLIRLCNKILPHQELLESETLPSEHHIVPLIELIHFAKKFFSPKINNVLNAKINNVLTKEHFADKDLKVLDDLLPKLAKSILQSFKEKLDAASSSVNESILVLYSPKTYKVIESILETIPQIILQLFVTFNYKQTNMKNDIVLYISLSLSIFSNTYGNALILFPTGITQIMIAFLYCLTDTCLRCGGILYICICVPFGWARVLVLLGYLFAGLPCVYVFNKFKFQYDDNDEMKQSEHRVGAIMYVFVSIWTLSLSSSAAFFLFTSGFNMDFNQTKMLFTWEILCRLIITIISAAIGTLYTQDYVHFCVAIIFAGIVNAVLMYALSERFETIRSPTQGVFGDLIIETIAQKLVQWQAFIIRSVRRFLDLWSLWILPFCFFYIFPWCLSDYTEGSFEMVASLLYSNLIGDPIQYIRSHSRYEIFNTLMRFTPPFIFIIPYVVLPWLYDSSGNSLQLLTISNLIFSFILISSIFVHSRMMPVPTMIGLIQNIACALADFMTHSHDASILYMIPSFCVIHVIFACGLIYATFCTPLCQCSLTLKENLFNPFIKIEMAIFILLLPLSMNLIPLALLILRYKNGLIVLFSVSCFLYRIISLGTFWIMGNDASGLGISESCLFKLARYATFCSTIQLFICSILTVVFNYEDIDTFCVIIMFIIPAFWIESSMLCYRVYNWQIDQDVDDVVSRWQKEALDRYSDV